MTPDKRNQILDEAWQASKKVWDQYDCKREKTPLDIANAQGAKACMTAIHALKQQKLP
jgi:hypothetical protein